MEGDVDALAPDTGRQTVSRVVRQLTRFGGCAEGHCRQHWSEDFLLRTNRRWMYVAQKRRRIIEPTRRQRYLRLPARRAVGDSLIHQLADSIELHAGHDRADVDGFVERRAYAQGAHAILHFGDQRFGDTLLHQQPGTRATNLPLIEPDSIYQPFHRAIKVSVLKDD